MNRALVAGLALTGAGLAGYVAGVLVTYPGRSVALTAIMVGVALTVVSRSGEGAA